MNKTGICNGLALVYAKYLLEGREKKFFQIIDYIGEGKVHAGVSDDEINIFVTEVLMTFEPEKYNQKLHQRNAIQMLKINNEPLKSSFDFALATSDAHWIELFKKLDLQSNEAVQVSSADHAITLSKKMGVYRIYDPNYSTGYQDFADEKQLISELHDNVFEYDRGNLGLDIHIISHPNVKPRGFPDIQHLYETYLPKTKKATAKCHGKEFATLNYAVANNGSDVISFLLEKGLGPINDAMISAVMDNNPSAFPALISKIDDDDEIEVIINIALREGRTEAFNALLENQKFKEFYETKLLNKLATIYLAASGGNSLLLEKVLDDFQHRPIVAKKKYFTEVYEQLEIGVNECIAADKETEVEITIKKKFATLISELPLEKQIDIPYLTMLKKFEEIIILRHEFPASPEKEEVEELTTPLIKKTIDDYVSPLEPELIEKRNIQISELINKQSLKSSDQNCIDVAIRSGSVSCVELLVNQLELSNMTMSDNDKLGYLLAAIRENQRHIVLTLIDKKPGISPELLSHISMTTHAVERTNLALLNDLEIRGMVFSDPSKTIIQQKKHQAIGVIESLGVLFYKFTDFFKEFIAPNLKGVQYDRNKYEKKLHLFSSVEQQIEKPDNFINPQPVSTL